MKFIYFDRLLFLNDDFELGLPIFLLCLNYYYIICVVLAFYMGVITPNIGTYLWLWCIYWIKIIKFSWWFHSKTYPHSWSPAAEKLTKSLSWIHPPMQNISSANQIKVCNRNPGYWVLYQFGHIILLSWKSLHRRLFSLPFLVVDLSCIGLSLFLSCFVRIFVLQCQWTEFMPVYGLFISIIRSQCHLEVHNFFIIKTSYHFLTNSRNRRLLSHFVISFFLLCLRGLTNLLSLLGIYYVR